MTAAESKRGRDFCPTLTVALLLVLVSPALALAVSIQLAWDIPEDISTIAGYRIYYGLAGTTYTHQPEMEVNEPALNTCDVSGLVEGNTYGFRATSFDETGQESDFSEEFVYTVPKHHHAETPDPDTSDSNSTATVPPDTDPDETDADATAPDTTITKGPAATLTTDNAAFAFTGSDPVDSTGLTYSCRLKGLSDVWSGYTAFTLRSYPGLTNGSYTFEVRAKDQSGNVDASPASLSFTVDIPAASPTNPDTDSAGRDERELLYFPHVATTAGWTTEITIVNQDEVAVSGDLLAYSAQGLLVDSLAVDLPASGRLALDVVEAFDEADDIRYLALSHAAGNLCGSTRFSMHGIYSAALPASRPQTSGDLLINHIASTSEWWTGLGLVNTTSQERSVTLRFNDGRTSQISIQPNGHTSVIVQDLFGGQAQPGLVSGVIEDAQGLVGLELFGNGEQLAGIHLSGETASSLVFPHLQSDSDWWTGLVVFNPGDSATNLTLRPYSATGEALASQTLTVAGGAKIVGSVQGLGLPADSAWLRVEADRPVSGFELFGSCDGQLLAGFSIVDLERQAGVFSKIEEQGWTAMALVNTADLPVQVTLTARDDNGEPVAQRVVTVEAHARTLGLVADLFTGQDLSPATQVAFAAAGPVAGFQLLGSDDGLDLDSLPGM